MAQEQEALVITDNMNNLEQTQQPINTIVDLTDLYNK